MMIRQMLLQVNRNSLRRYGELSKIRLQIVCEKALASVGRRINIGACIDMGRGEEQSGARNRESIVADATEALIGAVYIDGGFAAMRELVERLFSEIVDDAIHGRLFSDYKTRLQELVEHLTTRADDNHAPPVYLFPKNHMYLYILQVYVKPR